jgi:hypothetical protein
MSIVLTSPIFVRDISYHFLKNEINNFITLLHLIQFNYVLLNNNYIN